MMMTTLLHTVDIAVGALSGNAVHYHHIASAAAIAAKLS